jgi:hypothetical protein
LRLGFAGLLGIGALVTVFAAQASATGITKVVIQSSGVAFGGCSIGDVGTYTVIKGYAFDAIDPRNPQNTVIHDIASAAGDSNGDVEVVFNFYMIVPTNLANGNGKLVFEFPNRGTKTIGSIGRISTTSNDPASQASNCSGTFFYPQGYATVWSGWEYYGDPQAVQTATTTPATTVPSVYPVAFAASAAGVNGTYGTSMTTMPVAMGPNNAEITGPAYEYIVETGQTATYVLGGTATPSYPAATCNGAGSTDPNMVLTHRVHLDDTPQVITNWQYYDANCDTIELTTAGPTSSYTSCPTVTPGVGACFVPNDIYEFSYTAKNPTVNGAGFAVIRDWYSWLRNATTDNFGTKNPLAGYIKSIYTNSVSQPTRTLNDFIHLGFNRDLNGNKVFDGDLSWIGAGDGISMNYRWSQTSRTERNRQHHLYDEAIFPFADVTTRDPISGETDGRYAKCSVSNTCPSMNMEIYTDNEMWVKAGSLFTTDPTGRVDLPDQPGTRKFLMAGMQHGGGTQATKGNTGVCQYYNDPLDAEFTERALWYAMDQAITGHIPPPPSAVASLAGGTLVSPQNLAFPVGYQTTVNGAQIPVIYTGLETTRYRLNYGPTFYTQGVPTINPPIPGGSTAQATYQNNPAFGPIYPSYVPQTNSDGNDQPGPVLLPEILVPLATYMGWNYRSGPQAHDGCESTGAYIPFQPTAAARNAVGDPRPSAAERYPSYGAYLGEAVNAVDKLIWNRLFLCGGVNNGGAIGSSTNGPNTNGPDMNEVLANLAQDWTQVSGLAANVNPPALLPACNDSLTHAFDASSGGLGSSVLWRDANGEIGMWLVNGTTITKASVLAKVPANWEIVGQRAFDGSGNADILWRDTSGDLGLWLMNGTTITSASVLGQVPKNWAVAATGGMNTGGYGDIIWRDTAGDVAVWWMNGTTVVQTAIIGQIPTNWVIAGADPHGDIFWRNITTGEVGMWVLNGSKIVQAVDFGVVPFNWTIAGIGDFAGTGSYDILWRDNDGNVGIWLMNGTSIISESVVGNVPLNWTIAETGDFNGDGKSDILWSDSGGDVRVWFMNGDSISSTQTYGNVGQIFGNVGKSWMVQALNAE